MKTSSFMLLIGAAVLMSACTREEAGNASASETGAERNGSAGEREAGEEGEERAGAEQEIERFVNSRDYAINDRLRERYIDFSFEYPSSWRNIPQGNPDRESNFAQIRGPQRNGSDTATIAFGTAGFNNVESASQEEFEQLIERLGRDMGRSWRNYRLVSHGRQRLGQHDTWGWTFSTDLPGDNGETTRTHGRADIYLPQGRSHGLYVVTIVTENAEDMPEPREIGESGDIRRIYDSLSFGRPERSERRSSRDEGSRSSDDADLEPR